MGQLIVTFWYVGVIAILDIILFLIVKIQSTEASTFVHVQTLYTVVIVITLASYTVTVTGMIPTLILLAV